MDLHIRRELMDSISKGDMDISGLRLSVIGIDERRSGSRGALAPKWGVESGWMVLREMEL